jgi:N-acetylmuramoyl-L-alanine amidase
MIRNHRLEAGDGFAPKFVATDNAGGALTPEFLVMHFTAGTNARSAVDWLCNPASRASAHLVIGRDGSVTQLVPFNRQAWHAGRSRWLGRYGLNRFSLGIELDNAGMLTGGTGQWHTAWGTTVEDTDAVELPHKHDGIVRGWHVYTPAQLDVAREVAGLIVAEYGILDIIGHDDIAPGRKFDPGPAFPMESFREAVLGRTEDVRET